MKRMAPLLCILLLVVLPAAASGQTMADYTSYPLFLTQSVTPNILIILDNSGSMNFQAYTGAYDPNSRYYGYFDPDAGYTYSSQRFIRDTSGAWGGNFLNWVTMRRVDVARKVLVGGLAASRTGSGVQELIGEDPVQNGRDYWKDTVVGESPYDTNHKFLLDDGYIYVYERQQSRWRYTDERYNIRVRKSQEDEPEDFLDGNIAGIIQRVGDKARFGLEFFNTSEGGKVYSRIGGNITSMVTNIENKHADTWTPLAESFYEGARYFQQISPYYHNGDYAVNDSHDPYYWQDIQEFVPCAKSFVLLITDGESTQDEKIPAWLQDYDVDGNDPGTYSDNGTDYLDDVALWAHTDDLRSDLEGFQNLTLYTVMAFGSGSALLADAAKNGGFIEKNGNDRPDLTEEWDRNGDGDPDNYFVASEGYELENQLLSAITDILKRVASGTAVSVLSTSAQGEGNLFQAMFKPVVTEGLSEVNWVGYLQSLWVDRMGNLREDTHGDNHLVYTADLIIKYHFDEFTGDLTIEKYSDSDGDGEADSQTPVSTGGLDSLHPLWEAGKILALREASTRTIITFVDDNKDGQVTQSESLEFAHTNSATLRPYLRASDETEASNIINFIRGVDIAGFRSRKLTVDSQPNKVWKLGDIVDSTPTVVGKPMDDVLLLYGDQSYLDFAKKYKDRETVIYTGANDGMLHAFNGGKFRHGDDPGTSGHDTGWIEGTNLGSELWAYIPYNLLPHLKWLTDENYSHVYYVDLKPRVADVRIFNSDGDHPGGWGTILIGGMRFGGGDINVTDTFSGTPETRTFRSAYFAIDITVPDNPRPLWEFTDQNLGFTLSYPTISKVGDAWHLIVGSGPVNYDGTSNQGGSIFVLDLRTGNPLRRIEVGTNAFMASPISVDVELDYDVDVIYIGETYREGSNWSGRMHRLSTNGSADPGSWTLSTLFESEGPITSAPTAAVDKQKNLWVFFGTGRYLSVEDKADDTLQKFYGLKDKGSIVTSLFDATDVAVYENGTAGGFPNWNELVDYVRTLDGWFINLVDRKERSLAKPSILGGIVLFTTFAPDEDICGYGGDAKLYAVYFETGTAYKRSVIGMYMDGRVRSSIDLGSGMPAGIGIHVGQEDTAAGFIQLNTGSVEQVEVDPAFRVKSATVYWKQK
jgi:type IV pilus assembly protein PilY1